MIQLVTKKPVFYLYLESLPDFLFKVGIHGHIQTFSDVQCYSFKTGLHVC